ncbi:MAG TPA: helix-turn-helix transcriptional regulator [Thermoanaerobaculia bacterium]|nr:helix-turn-helix transcriptional regulator [Thermoanaerobaculia bacterium]
MRARRELPKLKPVELLVLAELDRQDQHGYGIVQAIERHTEGAVSLVPGNLYRVLHRLIDRGLIAEVDRPAAEPSEDQRRRYYRITETGREEVAREIQRVESLASLARGVGSAS